ncbi:MAG: hypothetical protein COA67_05755 [Lutibacter sp.]|nr:MAG: hypothetical protein COA67_05755 [Lutibacter sp.]
MKEQEELEYCKKCKKESSDNYCSNCGTSKELKRINKQYIIDEVGSILNFDKGIFYTTKELLIRPGKTVKEFVLNDRNRLVKPIVFIIICSLIYTISQQIFQFEDGYVNYSFDKDSASTTIFDWVTANYGYSNFLISIFIALWIKIFFRKSAYNFFEILILLCFVMGSGMLIFSLFGIIDSYTTLKIVDKGFFIGVVYIIWAIAQFFEGKRVINFLKAMFSYSLGIMTFTIAVLLIGFLIDFIK